MTKEIVHWFEKFILLKIISRKNTRTFNEIYDNFHFIFSSEWNLIIHKLPTNWTGIVHDLQNKNKSHVPDKKINWRMTLQADTLLGDSLAANYLSHSSSPDRLNMNNNKTRPIE